MADKDKQMPSTAPTIDVEAQKMPLVGNTASEPHTPRTGPSTLLSPEDISDLQDKEERQEEAPKREVAPEVKPNSIKGSRLHWRGRDYDLDDFDQVRYWQDGGKQFSYLVKDNKIEDKNALGCQNDAECRAVENACLSYWLNKVGA